MKSLQSRLLTHWFYRGPGTSPPAEPRSHSEHQQEPAQELSAALKVGLLVLEGAYLTGLALRELWARLKPPKKVHDVRVVGVGNLVVGGAGKTPCVLAIAQSLTKAGWRCGILSRGYRSQAEHGKPTIIFPEDLAQLPALTVGDEAWWLAWRTQCPVAVGRDRHSSLNALRAAIPDLNVVILDDGLQQRYLHCDHTVLVIDERGFGNGHCLPYGPLREPAIQLTRFTAWVNNGLQIAHLDGLGPLPRLSAPLRQVGSSWVPLTAWQTPEHWLSVDDGIAQLRGRRILAVAGIAKPEQFFQSLRDMGLAIETLPLADHDPELARRIEQQLQLTHYDHVLMTEKDAVKFFSTHRTLPSEAWALRRDAQCDSEFIQRMIHGPKTPRDLGLSKV